MANIHFVRKYNVYGTEYCDVAYIKDGYISRIVCYDANNIPKTVENWLENKKGRRQFDLLNKEEVIFL